MKISSFFSFQLMHWIVLLISLLLITPRFIDIVTEDSLASNQPIELPDAGRMPELPEPNQSIAPLIKILAPVKKESVKPNKEEAEAARAAARAKELASRYDSITTKNGLIVLTGIISEEGEYSAVFYTLTKQNVEARVAAQHGQSVYGALVSSVSKYKACIVADNEKRCLKIYEPTANAS